MTPYHWLVAACWLGLLYIIAALYRNMQRLHKERERWRKAHEDFVEQMEKKSAKGRTKE